MNPVLTRQFNHVFWMLKITVSLKIDDRDIHVFKNQNNQRNKLLRSVNIQNLNVVSIHVHTMQPMCHMNKAKKKKHVWFTLNFYPLPKTFFSKF